MLENITYKISDFDYDLPQELIAQTPIEPRDASRLLVVHRDSGKFEHRRFTDIGAFLRPGDLLIANQSRVLPARLLGHRVGTGGSVEVLLLVERPDLGLDYWETLVRPGRRLREGSRIVFGDETGNDGEMQQGAFLQAEVLERTEAGGRIVRFTVENVVSPMLERERGRDKSRPYERQDMADRGTGTRAGVNPAPTFQGNRIVRHFSVPIYTECFRCGHVCRDSRCNYGLFLDCAGTHLCGSRIAEYWFCWRSRRGFAGR